METATCTLLGMPKPDEEKKLITVSTRLTLAEFGALERLAKADDRTPSYILAKAFREYLERQGKQRH